MPRKTKSLKTNILRAMKMNKIKKSKKMLKKDEASETSTCQKFTEVSIDGMFDTEKLILELQDQPVIWNTEYASCNNFYRGEDRRKAWLTVAETLTSGWQTMSDGDQQLMVKNLQNKWKNIKDQFRKSLQAQKTKKSGFATKYVFADRLKFLIPFMPEKRAPDNIQPIDPKKIKIEMTTDEETTDPIATTSQATPHTIKPALATRQPSKRYAQAINSKQSKTGIKDSSWKRYKRNEDPRTEEKLLEMLIKTEEMEKMRLEDEDSLFLMSLLPTLKKMSESAKLKTRIDILQAVYRNLQEDPANNQPVQIQIQESNLFNGGHQGIDVERLLKAEIDVEEEGVQFHRDTPNLIYPVDPGQAAVMVNEILPTLPETSSAHIFAKEEPEIN